MNNAKEYFEELRRQINHLEDIKDELTDLWNLATGLKAVSYETKEGVSGSINNRSPQEKYLMPIIQKEAEQEKAYLQACKMLSQAWEFMQILTDREREVLRNTYILGYQDKESAELMSIEPNSVLCLRRYALIKLDNSHVFSTYLSQDK